MEKKLQKKFLLTVGLLTALTTQVAAAEFSVFGTFCVTPEQIDTYITEQQHGKSPADAFDVINKPDKACALMHVMATNAQPIGKEYNFLGKHAFVTMVRVVAFLPIPKHPELYNLYKRLDEPIILYTPMSVRDGNFERNSEYLSK